MFAVLSFILIIYDTLSFNIYNEYYSFKLDLNCKLEELLKIPMNEPIDMEKYILDGDTILNVNKLAYINPNKNIKITRYLNKKFSEFLTFYTESSNDRDNFSGVIEFTFDLDDYFKK